VLQNPSRQRLGLLIGAIVLAALSTATGVRLFLLPSPISPLLVSLSAFAWIAILVTPLLVSISTAYTQRKSGDMTVVSALTRWRVLLLIVLGLVPVLVLQTLYVNTAGPVQDAADHGCYDSDNQNVYCAFDEVTPTAWYAAGESLLAAVLGLCGVTYMAAAIGVRGAGAPFLAIGGACVFAIALVVVGSSLDSYASFDLPLLRVMLVTILPYAIGLWLSRSPRPESPTV
jgi:hypothetical protein